MVSTHVYGPCTFMSCVHDTKKNVDFGGTIRFSWKLRPLQHFEEVEGPAGAKFIAV